ncbi:MAG: carboxypeptidase regulatory-like domain-containing protein [Armatimonadetes bacterium]|nr:carboxypeptidase regulatory-like domain-containing protein [Armatimonadota bacterium]MDW8027072.1 carboxypeptidase regulatory-like domain-containing protein [Armatimonadota bacterium]
MKRTPHWSKNVLAGLIVVGAIWFAIVVNSSPPQTNPVSISPDWQEALRQYLQNRKPGLENQLRQAWQKRALASRQPRVQELPLTEAPGNERTPTWSPDRRFIAFSTNSVDSNGNRRLDRNDGTGTRFRIWIMEPDGSNARPAIPENEIPPTVPIGDELFPAWFPDSGVLAFVLSAGGVTDIYTVNLRRSPVEIQRRTFGLRGVRKISVAPSGAEIAFEQNNQIYLLSLDTGAIRQLTTEGRNRNPAYLPDGRILYESNIDPNTNQPGAYFHIWIMRGDGANKRPITTGEQNDTEPAAIFYTHPNSVLGRAPYNFRLAFTSDRNGNRDIFITDESGTRIRQVSVIGNRTQEFQATVEPFPVEALKIERVAFVTTRAGNEDIWLISSFDIFPPMLSDQFGNPILPKITPKINLPGDTITLEAAVYDPESGVDKVYAIFKSADDPLFLWALHFEGFPGQANPPNPGDQAAIAHEVDWFIVNFDPDTGQDRNPPLVNHLELMYSASGGTDINRYWQSIQPYAIELFDDGTHGDRRARDGIYTRRIKLPSTPRDYFVDIIPFDNSGNFPSTYVVMAISEYYSMVMPTPFDYRQPDTRIEVINNNIVLVANRWLDVMPSVGYDNIVGCTSKPFTAEDLVLFVSDYGCGQKWTTARSVELGNFQIGFFFIRLPDGRLLTVAQNYPGIPTESYYFGDIWADSYVRPGNPQKGVIGRPLAPFPISDRVAVWRTLCRGPLPDEILFLYLPRPFVDPVLRISRLYADRAVLWHAPYTGSLWVDKGTLEDPITQGKLKRFLDRSGRLCITSGQDLGWALTVNGQVSNDFLTNYVRARFSRVVGGFYGDYSFDLISGYQAHRHKLAGGLIASGIHDWGQGFTFNEDTTARDGALIDPDQERGGTAGGIELLGWSYPNWDGARNPYDPPLNPDFSGAGCENALVMDTVDVVSGGIAFYTYTQGGTNAAIQYRDPRVDFRIVTFFFPFEALNDGFKDTTIGQVTFSEALGFKQTLMNYIMDFLRTGSITGKVVDTQGNPLEGFTVRAQIGSLSPNPIIFGGDLTKRDGSYEIIGLNTGVYDLEVSVPGWTSRILRTTCEGVQGDNATPFVSPLNDFTMTKLPPGSISGKVTELDGTTPIIGATVRAVIVADERGNPIVLPPGIPSTYTATTKADGTYRIEGVPNATYDVTASAPRHTSVTRTGVVVRPGEETTGVDFQLPGEPGVIVGQVIDAQTNQGIAGALVTVISGTTTVASATTDPQGNFTIPNVPVGVYTVQATAPNYKPASVTGVQVQTGATTRVTLALSRAQPGSISGRVTRADGTPIGGVTVEVVQPATGEVVVSVVTEDRFTVIGGYSRNYLIANVPLGTYTVRIRALGYTPTPTERTGIVVQEATETQNVNFVLRAEYTFPRGIQLISIPYDYTGTGLTINNLLGTDRIITWETDPNLTDPMTGYRGGRYVRFPVPPADAVYLGRGYFVRFDRSSDFTQPGAPAPTDQPFLLTLDKPGWWLIGAPFRFKVDWTRTRVINRATNQTLSLREASLQGWMSDTLFALNQFATGYVTSVFMEPFKGYWVYVQASQGVILIIDNTPTRQMAINERASRGKLALIDGRISLDSDGWLLPIKLTIGDQVLSTVQIGISPKASDGLDALDLLSPPSLRQWVSEWVTFGSNARIGRSETLLYADIRAPSAKPQVWDIVIEAPANNQTLTVLWDGINERVPSNTRLVLIDPETGEARYMRTTGGYTFVLREGVKRLRVISEQKVGSGLRILGLRPEITRGGQLVARFTLTEPAEVECKLVTLTGRTIYVVQPRRLMTAGEQRILWDGRNVNGGLPKGFYLLEVCAYGERGERVRAIMPLRW